MIENIVKTVEQFLNFSDEKLEELSILNQELRVTTEDKGKEE